MGKNILGTSEFLAGVGALAQGVLIGQPNAKSSAAWAAAQAVKKQASVRAAQEALEKERKEKDQTKYKDKDKDEAKDKEEEEEEKKKKEEEDRKSVV